MVDKKIKDYNYWKKMDLWTLTEAVHLLLGLEPPRWSILPDREEKLKHRWESETAKSNKIKDIRELVVRSAQAGSLNYDGNFNFKPRDFIIWAKSKTLTVPKKLKDLDDSGLTTPSAPYTRKEHRNYSKELDIAVQAWLEISQYADNTIKTARNKIMQWLNDHHPKLKKNAKDRIATLANPARFKGGAPKQSKNGEETDS
jgi:hypothetical protein